MFRWCFFHAQNWREKLGNPVEFVVKRNVTYMQVACPPLRSAHQVIFFFFFHFKVSQKPLISPSTSSLDSQPRWAFLLGGFIFRVLLLILSHPFSFTPKMTKLLSGGKSQQVSSQMQFFLNLQRKMKFALESKSIRSYYSNFCEMSKTKLVRFPF